MITFKCRCGKIYTVEDHLAGRAVKCQKCRQTMTIPAWAQVVAATPVVKTSTNKENGVDGNDKSWLATIRNTPAVWLSLNAFAACSVIAILVVGLLFFLPAANVPSATQSNNNNVSDSGQQLSPPLSEIVELDFSGKYDTPRTLTPDEWSTILATKSSINLDLSGTTTTDDDLKQLGELNIQSLCLSSCNQITDAGIAYLKEMPQLHSLKL